MINPKYTTNNLIPNNPSVGMVIGTYGSIPYVHLQLESMKRHNKYIPILINDDCSSHGDELLELCYNYKCDLIANDQKKGAQLGDLSAFVNGLDWAHEKKIDILLKVSRRYLIIKPWTNSLKELAIGSQETTYSNACSRWNFGFRSECVGMHVPSWINFGALTDMRTKFEENKPFDSVPEAYYHNLARQVTLDAHNNKNNNVYKSYNTLFQRTSNWDGYAPWPLMGMARNHILPKILWYETNSPQDYRIIAKKWNLNYSQSEFDKVND